MATDDQEHVCSECDEPVDKDGDTLVELDCVMPGWHPTECDECGAT